MWDILVSLGTSADFRSVSCIGCCGCKASVLDLADHQGEEVGLQGQVFEIGPALNASIANPNFPCTMTDALGEQLSSEGFLRVTCLLS